MKHSKYIYINNWVEMALERAWQDILQTHETDVHDYNPAEELRKGLRNILRKPVLRRISFDAYGKVYSENGDILLGLVAEENLDIPVQYYGNTFQLHLDKDVMTWAMEGHSPVLLIRTQNVPYCIPKEHIHKIKAIVAFLPLPAAIDTYYVYEILCKGAYYMWRYGHCVRKDDSTNRTVRFYMTDSVLTWSQPIKNIDEDYRMDYKKHKQPCLLAA